MNCSPGIELKCCCYFYLW